MSLPQPGLVPVIAADDRGFATIVWEATSGRGATAVADLSPRGRVLAVRRLSAGGTPLIAADGNGDLVATWGVNPVAAFRPAGQRHWCPPISLHQSPEVQVAIAPDGIAQVIMHRGSDIQYNAAVQARTLTRCRA